MPHKKLIPLIILWGCRLGLSADVLTDRGCPFTRGLKSESTIAILDGTKYALEKAVGACPDIKAQVEQFESSLNRLRTQFDPEKANLSPDWLEVSIHQLNESMKTIIPALTRCTGPVPADVMSSSLRLMNHLSSLNEASSPVAMGVIFGAHTIQSFADQIGYLKASSRKLRDESDVRGLYERACLFMNAANLTLSCHIEDAKKRFSELPSDEITPELVKLFFGGLEKGSLEKLRNALQKIQTHNFFTGERRFTLNDENRELISQLEDVLYAPMPLSKSYREWFPAEWKEVTHELYLQHVAKALADLGKTRKRGRKDRQSAQGKQMEAILKELTAYHDAETGSEAEKTAAQQLIAAIAGNELGEGRFDYEAFLKEATRARFGDGLSQLVARDNAWKRLKAMESDQADPQQSLNRATARLITVERDDFLDMLKKAEKNFQEGLKQSTRPAVDVYNSSVLPLLKVCALLPAAFLYQPNDRTGLHELMPERAVFAQKYRTEMDRACKPFQCNDGTKGDLPPFAGDHPEAFRQQLCHRFAGYDEIEGAFREKFTRPRENPRRQLCLSLEERPGKAMVNFDEPGRANATSGKTRKRPPFGHAPGEK